MGEEMRILSIHPCGPSRIFLHTTKSYDMGPSSFTSQPKEEGVLRIFIALAGFEPATFGSSGKHSNHYTTKATYASLHIYRRPLDTGEAGPVGTTSVLECSLRVQEVTLLPYLAFELPAALPGK
jgi:hypothetical protein